MGYFHTTTVICQEAGTVKEAVSVCVCVFALCVSSRVSACLRAVSRSNAEGGKTITTHLPATIAAYMSAKEAAKSAITVTLAQQH